MEVADFLSRLQSVKKASRPGSWIACCPGHEDASPSLSVKELGDGRILIHCFAGCETGLILRVMDLTVLDLIPEHMHYIRDREQRIAPVRAFTAYDALVCLRHEGSVLALSAADLAEGKAVDQDRLTIACGRISEALEFLDGHG